jgi:tight adherence protein B
VHNELTLVILLALSVVVGGGIFVTRAAHVQRRRAEVRDRLEALIGSPETAAPLPIKIRNAQTEGQKGFPFLGNALKSSGIYRHIQQLHEMSGIKTALDDLLSIMVTLVALAIALPVLLDLPALPCFAAAIAIGLVPYIVIRQKAERRRNKFLLQLPNAIDLMVSILRSGHSIPQSVRSVADESPAPCGEEFNHVFHRMNLGQSLPVALRYSVHKYDSFELDLIARATSIQQEVGGSLAELLEKTNDTLRQRIKLKNQVATMTAQGRLSALICGLLPIVIGFAFTQINPNYMRPLFENSTGQMLLAAALGLELLGFVIMRKLSTFRI